MPLDHEISAEHLYIGHFTCEPASPPPAGEFEDERFTLVANAPDSVAALNKFRALIHAMHDAGDVFADVAEIFLDSCSEVRAMPAKGFMPFFEKRRRVGRTGFRGSISLANYGADPPDVEGYSFGENKKGHDEPQPSPFVTFYATPADRRRIAMANRQPVTTKPQ